MAASEAKRGRTPVARFSEARAEIDPRPGDELERRLGRHAGEAARTDRLCGGKLGIEVGETTDDGQFTLIELECLGACGGGPAILIDETLHENVKPTEVAKLIDRAAAGGPHH